VSGQTNPSYRVARRAVDAAGLLVRLRGRRQ